MVLLRRVIGDALRGRRQRQHRTLREVSTAANVSLGYLSEIERGQKEASSELLSSICDALGAQLSEVLREVSDTLALAEQLEGLENGRPVEAATAPAAPAARKVIPGTRKVTTPDTKITDGQVSVTVRHDSPLRTTLMATRNRRPGRTLERTAG
ncbi:MAG: helix-turn-helix transcriptional regulator [Hamadaea sp.]|uniref:helix-turn-helix domain-containing protein n=1 Tax=Hamadaea sp. TaxID=2024425 RepID=UPI0017D39B32|nr:helix-turn-helix transcriptional regulator [Hamadaea sp.]NUR72651.1 helix-turn-helix transcriptional regulator [Hamadaea sp.]NUT19746.1 helix-turn-helix transcriptional regulator [Hamadaea sp.]